VQANAACAAHTYAAPPQPREHTSSAAINQASTATGSWTARRQLAHKEHMRTALVSRPRCARHRRPLLPRTLRGQGFLQRHQASPCNAATRTCVCTSAARPAPQRVTQVMKQHVSRTPRRPARCKKKKLRPLAKTPRGWTRAQPSCGRERKSVAGLAPCCRCGKTGSTQRISPCDAAAPGNPECPAETCPHTNAPCNNQGPP
jgi:hypothetical protein